MRSALDRGSPSECPSLVLDAADARTTAALASARAARDPRGPGTGAGPGGTAGDEEFDGEAVAYEDKWEGERVLVSAEFREGSLDVEFEPSARGEDGGGAGRRRGRRGGRGARRRRGGRDEFLRGFPPRPSSSRITTRTSCEACAAARRASPVRSGRRAVAVRGVRGGRRGKSSRRAAPTRRGSARLDLDHCGAVAQREQLMNWDVFSRHAVCDGGVLAATFLTRGKRRGWSKAAAVATCARALVERGRARGRLEGAADGGGCASEPGADAARKTHGPTVRFAESGGGGTEVTEGGEVIEGGSRGTLRVSARGARRNRIKRVPPSARRCWRRRPGSARTPPPSRRRSTRSARRHGFGDGGEISEGSPEIADEGEMVPAGLDEAFATPRRSLRDDDASASGVRLRLRLRPRPRPASGASVYGSAVRLAAALDGQGGGRAPAEGRSRLGFGHVVEPPAAADVPVRRGARPRVRRARALARLAGASAAFSSPSSGFVS